MRKIITRTTEIRKMIHQEMWGKFLVENPMASTSDWPGWKLNQLATYPNYHCMACEEAQFPHSRNIDCTKCPIRGRAGSCYDLRSHFQIWNDSVHKGIRIKYAKLISEAWDDNKMTLEKIIAEFKKEMFSLSLDERDNYPNFSEMVKRYIGIVPYSDRTAYGDMLKVANEASELAESLAKAYRASPSKEQIGKLEDRYKNALEWLF